MIYCFYCAPPVVKLFYEPP